jgi:hypothetical protein
MKFIKKLFSFIAWLFFWGMTIITAASLNHLITTGQIDTDTPTILVGVGIFTVMYWLTKGVIFAVHYLIDIIEGLFRGSVR